MPETQKASTGFNGEVYISTTLLPAGLKELVQVVSFNLPSDQGERVETTHLKSPGRRREYTSGLIDAGEIEVTLNFRPNSDTDILLEAAITAGDNRLIHLGVPELGVLTRMYRFAGVVLSYDKGEVSADGKMEATVTIAINGAVSASAYAAPPAA